jgi:phosphoglycerate dehydrogenase-like enzyme
MVKVLLPTEAMAHHCRRVLDRAGEGTETEILVWDIDSQETPPPAEIVVTSRPHLPSAHHRIERVEGLRHVHLLSLGYEWILPHVGPTVGLSNSRGAIEDATAEFGLTLILSALREMPRIMEQADRRYWDRSFWTRSLSGSAVLVLGYGGVGSAVVARLEAFGPASVTVVASAARRHHDGRWLHGLEELPQLLPEADVVVIALPRTRSTEGLVDSRFLAQMRCGSLLVNIGRGAIVDHDALSDELREGRIGAALDVVDPEPLPPEHALWDAPHLILAPHMGGNTHETVRRAENMAVEQVVRFIQGTPLMNIVSR